MGTEVPQWVQGRSPGRGLGTKMSSASGGFRPQSDDIFRLKDIFYAKYVNNFIF